MDDFNDGWDDLPDAIFPVLGTYYDELREVALLAAGCIVYRETGEMLAWGNIEGSDFAVLELAGCIDAWLD